MEEKTKWKRIQLSEQTKEKKTYEKNIYEKNCRCEWESKPVSEYLIACRENTEEEQKEFKMTLYAPKVRILAVDDTKMNLFVVKALLKRTAMQLDLASGGNECLELCRKNTYDLIFMDHMMPEPDGIETLHLLRQDEDGLNRKTKVVVLTANAISGVREKYIEEGFDDYLSKPLLGEDLENMLKNHLPKEKLEKSPEQIEHEEARAKEQERKAMSDAVAKTAAMFGGEK